MYYGVSVLEAVRWALGEYDGVTVWFLCACVLCVCVYAPVISNVIVSHLCPVSEREEKLIDCPAGTHAPCACWREST